MSRKTKYTKEVLEPVVNNCIGYKDVMRKLGLSPSSGNMFYFIRNKIKEYGIDTSHFQPQKPFRGENTLEKVMVENSTYSRSHLKRRLIKLGLLTNICVKCGLKGVWNNEPINMVLDHINGKPEDHRLGNLRMLCPNCNSQLPTHCSRNRKKK